MFDFKTAWKTVWSHSDEPAERMPLTEKENGKQVPYPYQVKKVKINDSLEIAYIDEGDVDADVLLLIHGMGSGIPVWKKNIDVLKKHYRCVALDLPGHGLSSRGDFPYTMAFYAEVVLSFIHKVRLPPLILIGHSLGGQTAIIAALKEQTLIKKLILISPAGIEPYTPVEKQTLITMAAGVVASGNAFTKNRFNYMVGFCNNQEEAGELARQMAFYKDDAAAFGKMMLRSIEAMLLESVNHLLYKITQPCLMLVGEDDKISPYQYLRGQDYADLVAREAVKLPNGKLVIFSSCGHFAQYQRPKSFNKVVLEFLKGKEVV